MAELRLRLTAVVRRRRALGDCCDLRSLRFPSGSFGLLFTYVRVDAEMIAKLGQHQKDTPQLSNKKPLDIPIESFPNREEGKGRPRMCSSFVKGVHFARGLLRDRRWRHRREVP